MRSLAFAFTLAIAAQTSNGDSAPSFRNDVMAVLSKAGCNAGTCHGNKNGKGGFNLSLRGQDPHTDYIALTRDVFGRRVDVLHPDESLLLKKATTGLAHGGGIRFGPETPEYGLFRDWIRNGASNDIATAPRVVALEGEPKKLIVLNVADSFSLQPKAVFSDGTTRDVTSLVVFESVNRAVKVTGGVVKAERECETTILLRYLDQQAAVRMAFIPPRHDFKWTRPSPNNYIDSHIFDKLRALHLNPATGCDDRTFLRRAYLDLIGLLPTPSEARRFLNDTSSAKRRRLVDALLERSEFADFWTLKWADLLRAEAHSLDQKGVQNFHHWLRQSIAESKPIDQLARELLGGTGSTYTNPSANYYRPNRDPARRARAVAQVFLGARLQCAECHNHPSDRWTQDDYYDWSSVFAGVKYKVLANNREISSDEHEWNGEQIVFVSRKGSLKNPRSGEPAKPRFLGQEAAGDKSAFHELSTWLTKSNAHFARVQVNRTWFHLMGRGLVDPPDDHRATNPASHPELLEALAHDFIASGYDLKHLIRQIMASRTYQLVPGFADDHGIGSLNYMHTRIRRLTAEQLLDCQSQVADVPLRFKDYPAGMRAAQLPGVRPESKGKRRANDLDRFLETFGKPPRLLSSDEERSCECTLNQAFQLVTGSAVTELVAEKSNRIGDLIDSGLSNEGIVREIFQHALTRKPAGEELSALLPAIDSAPDRRSELEDILWGVLNSQEFLFRL